MQTVLTGELSYHEKIQNTLRNRSAMLLFICCVFPYISPVNLGFDTQPYALLFSVVIFAYFSLRNRSINLNAVMFTLLLMFVYACFLFLLSPDRLIAARSLAGYATLFFVTYASFKTCNVLKSKWLNTAVYLWFGVGVIQTVLDKMFGVWLLPRMSTTEARGVTSLAVEPSYYAIICVFLLIVNDLLMGAGKQTNRKYILVTFLLILQIVITFSGVGFLFLFIYLISRFIGILIKDGFFKHAGKLFLIIALLVAVFVSFRTIGVLEYSRAGMILEALMAEPKLLLVTDASISDRLTHAVLPVYSLFYSNGLGLGMGQWSQYSSELRDYAGGFVATMAQYSSLESNRIMSGWGTAFFELGAIGLVYVVVYIKIMWSGWKKSGRLSMVYISSGITLLLMMTMSVPLAFPLFGYVLGMFMYHAIEDY